MSNSFQHKLERGRGGGGLYLDWLIIGCVFCCCLRENGPGTGGAYKLGRGL